MAEEEFEASTDEELVVDDGITDSDLEHENAQRGAPRRRSSYPRRHKKKKKSRRATSESGSESESPVSDSLRQGKENRRINSIMPTTTRASGKKVAGNTDYSKELAEQKAKSAKQEEELDRLRQALLKEQANNNRPMKPSSRARMTDEEKKWKADIQRAVKIHVWGSKKFINSEEALIKTAAKLFDKWNLKEHEGLTGDELKTARTNWVTRNLELIRVALNDIRNYAQSQLRSVITERIIHGKWVPTPEEINKCAVRDKDFLGNEENHKIFDFYWDTLLFKVVGKEHWDGWIRHYTTISKPPKNPGVSPENVRPPPNNF